VDAVVLVYLHLPPSLRADVHAKLAQALRPGAWWIMEAFHPQQLQHSSGGPKDGAMLYTPEMISADLAPWLQPQEATTVSTTLDEGPGHQGLAQVTRWVGQRVA
jgi:hypothetical protein